MNEQEQKKKLVAFRKVVNAIVGDFRFSPKKYTWQQAKDKLAHVVGKHVAAGLDEALQEVDLDLNTKPLSAEQLKSKLESLGVLVIQDAPKKLKKPKRELPALANNCYKIDATLAEFEEHLGLLANVAKDVELIAKSTEESSGPDSSALELPDIPEEIKTDFTLFNFQKKAVKHMWNILFGQKQPACILQAGVGTGKTFMVGRLARGIIDSGYLEKTLSPWPILYVTKATIVEQTERVLRDKFGIDTVSEVIITNYDQLRAKLGSWMIKKEVVVKGGEEQVILKWKPRIHPLIILWDECQSLKNESSEQSKIGQAFNDLLKDNPDIKQVFFSATLGTCVAEFKCIAVATQKVTAELAPNLVSRLSNTEWPSWSRMIASPSVPIEHSPAAMDRLMDELEPWMVRVKGVKPQFKAINRVKMIPFQSQKAMDMYNIAYERYLEALSKIDKEAPGGRFEYLAQLTIFGKAAETCRAEVLAEDAYQKLQNGYAPVIATRFKETIARTISDLVFKYKVPREKISVIWGGMDAKPMSIAESVELIKRVKAKDMTISDKDLKRLEHYLKNKEDDEDTEKAVEQAKLYDSLGLGMQNREQRQLNIDAFQRQDTDVCLFTSKAGGVGLSLHHTDEFVEPKCRRKPSGYVYEEDIPLVPTKPRALVGTFVYSAIELIQYLGRCPRLTSLSDTEQILIGYQGTVEEHSRRIIEIKMRCLARAVRFRESWEDIINNPSKVEEHINQLPENVDSEDEFIQASESDTDEE